VAYVEQADSGTHGVVFFEDARVLDGHVPAAKIDHFGTASEVGFEERSALQTFSVTFGEFLRVFGGFLKYFGGFLEGLFSGFKLMNLIDLELLLEAQFVSFPRLSWSMGLSPYEMDGSRGGMRPVAGRGWWKRRKLLGVRGMKVFWGRVEKL
jgi:hypothetical protein